jgi:DNA invertase Pin-like site-specific DNA recombinase
MPQHYVIYCRKSSESEERQVLSIESQLNELQQLVERLHLPVLDTITESRSAKYPGRTGFNALMQRVYKGEIKGIICWKLDRLARNPVDGGMLIWALDQGKLHEIISPHNTFHNNSNDKFLMQIEFGMAKKYVDDLSDNVKRGNHTKLEKGWLPGLPPLGYLNEPKERTIVPDPERFTLVRKMWDMLFSGILPFRIHRIVKEQFGLRSRFHRKTGGQPLSLSGVYKLFNNPFYYGLIQRKEGVYIGKHQPMITEDEYWKAQAILGHKGKQRPKTREFAYTGFIRCGECSCGITAEEKVNRYGSHYTYYHCTKKRLDVLCSQKVIRLEELEQQIVEYLERISVPKTLLECTLNYLERIKANEKDTSGNVTSSLQKAYDACERKLSNLTQIRLGELIDDEEYVNEKKRLLNEKIRLETQLQGEDNSWERSVDLTAKTFQFACEAKKCFLEGSLQQKKLIVQSIGSNFLLKDKKLSIDVSKPFVLIQNGLAMVGKENERFEHTNNRTNTIELVASGAKFQLWCTVVDDVRTYFQNCKTEFRIPDFCPQQSSDHFVLPLRE